MTILDKYVRNIKIFFIGGFVLGLLMLFVSRWFAVPFFLFVMLFGFYSENLRCPRCKKRAPYTWIPWVPQQCRNCGFSFVEEDVEEEAKKQD